MGFLATLLSRATPENPSFDLNSPVAWDVFTDGEPSLAGVRVNRETALSYAAWWRGINLLTRDVAKLPLLTYRRNGEGKDRDTSHPVYGLLRRKPNPYQSALTFRQQLTGHALSTGNGYAFIERKRGSIPVNLWPLEPTSVEPKRVGNDVKYTISSGGIPKDFDPMDILHVKGFCFDGIKGVSVVEKAKQSLGLGLAVARSQASFYGKGSRPSVVLETDGILPDDQVPVYRDAWDRLQAGPDNAGRTAILDRGLKAKPISFTADDNQLIQTRQFEIREIANWIGVPPHKLGDNSRTAYNSLEQENQSYLDDSLDFWLCNWEEECWDKLLTEAEKDADDHVIEFLRVALMRADLTARANYYRTALAGRSWMTPNEVRGRENMNPDAGDDSDKILTPTNMAKPGEAPPGEKPKPDAKPPADTSKSDAPIRAAANKSMSDAIRRARTRIATHGERAAKSAKGFLTWIDEIGETHGEALRAIMAPPFEMAFALDDGDPPAERIATFIESLKAELLEVAGSATAKELPAAVKAWGEGG